MLYAIAATTPFYAVAGPSSQGTGPDRVVALAETGAVHVVTAGRPSMGGWRAATQSLCMLPAPVAQILMSDDDQYARDEVGRVYRRSGALWAPDTHSARWQEVEVRPPEAPLFALVTACPGGVIGWTRTGHAYSTVVAGHLYHRPHRAPCFYPVAGHVASSANIWMGPPLPSSLRTRPLDTAIHFPEMMDTMERGSLLNMVVRGHAAGSTRAATYHYVRYTWEETAARGHTVDSARATAHYYARYNWEVSGDYRVLGVYPLLRG